MINNNQNISINNIFYSAIQILKYIKHISVIVISIWFIFFIFKNPITVSQGVSQGLDICKNVIFPSMFPFMVICNFICFSPLFLIITKFLGPIFKFIFRLPDKISGIIFCSLIGGYPTGAKITSHFFNKNQLSKDMANKLLCFCVNAGPAFIVNAVGYTIYKNHRIGIYLLISHILGSIIIGFLLSFFPVSSQNDLMNNQIDLSFLPYSEAFVKSVVDSLYSIFNISSFVIIFSVIILAIKESFVNNNYLTLAISFLEVSVGLQNILNFDLKNSLLIASFLISFSGLSVIFQILYFTKGDPIDKKRFFLFRIIHGLISSLITFSLINFFPLTQTTSNIFYNHNIKFFSLSPSISLIICIILLLFIIFSYSDLFYRTKN